MKTKTDMTLSKTAESFILRNARPLDLARWNFHFNQGSKDDVLKALAAYQNPDGGFGHGLEPDSFNPESSPIQTWAALEILEEIGVDEPTNPIIQAILTYLEHEPSFDGRYWRNTIPSNNDHPHAPWWTDDGAPNGLRDDNPSAYLAGFILRHASKASKIHEIGLSVAQHAIDAFNMNHETMEMHLVACYAHLFEDLLHCPEFTLNHQDLFEINLKDRIDTLIVQDLSRWDQGYVCFPNRFIQTKNSPFYPAHRETIKRFCAYLKAAQGPDGLWPVTWSWAQYPESWPLAKAWWQANILIKNLLFLKTFEEKAP